MYFSKVRKVISPERGHGTDAGIDFFMPEFNDEFVEDLKSKNESSSFSITDDTIRLGPQQRLMIPSGIHVNLIKTRINDTKWDGIMLVAHNKSGVSTKKGLDVLANVVDESYMGEIHISLVNTSDKAQEITTNQKIIQFIVEETTCTHPTELPINELYTTVTDRGTGGFGSTDK